MKIDRSRVRKSTSEVPLECQQLIERLQQCSRTELLDELSRIHSWTFGKCELLHWAQVLDIFDKILGEAAERSPDNKWILKCDTYIESELNLLICILRFTSLLIEHSFSRHLYNSMEHLLVLQESNEMSVVLEVLNLLYMFSKRSNFITRLKTEEKECLLVRLSCLGESWGGKENGFGLADCCNPEKEIPSSATTLHVEFHPEDETQAVKFTKKDTRTCGKHNFNIIHIEHIDKLHKTPAEIMKSLISLYYVPPNKEVWLFTHVRLASHFADYQSRLKMVQARLQALSVIVYSNAIQEVSSNLLYNGLLEELVEVVELQDPYLSDIRCAALRTLTAIIHLDRGPHLNRRPTASRLNNIIDVTGASLYHGFLPALVRNCISSLTNQVDCGQSAFKKMKLQDSTSETDDFNTSRTSTSTSNLDSVIDTTMEFKPQRLLAPSVGDSKYPVSLTTALFSFLYHLASYQAGGEALVSCGMMESLLQVINWQGFELDHINFVTRAVRVIDLITNIDMTAFQTYGGLYSFINRLDIEVNFCKKEQIYRVNVRNVDQIIDETPINDSAICSAAIPSTSGGSLAIAGPSTSTDKEMDEDIQAVNNSDVEYIAENTGKSCLPQRAALLKSMLNFLKKAFNDAAFSESIRHLMEGTLPNSLKNLIANAEYYGPSLFLLATDVVTVYVYQEPSLLSALQENGLTDIILYSLLVKEVPATREVLGSLPNVFSALCLNNRGLEAFAKYNPFNKLFNILLSPNYLPAMRRRRSSEPTNDTASVLGNAMDELMRHQPSLRQDATVAIINLLKELVKMGTDPKYVCWRPHSKSDILPPNNSRSANNTEGSSDEEDDDEEEASTSSQNAQTERLESQPQVNSERQPIALIDYILNAMKFIDSILSNNSTDDHCREFCEREGIEPLLQILGLPNLPVDCPVTNPAQAVATVCKSILNLAHEPFLFSQGLAQLDSVLKNLKPLYAKTEVPGASKLLLELVGCSDLETAFSTATATPILHAMNAAHGYVIMFVHICRTGQTEIRNLSLQRWGSSQGLAVLKGLSELYTSLVWESTLLLAYCSDDLLPSDCDFTREDIEKLNAFFDKCEGTSTNSSASTSDNNTPAADTPASIALAAINSSALDHLTSNYSMDLDGDININKDSRNLKIIKPLLGASSRLGRALAELFGLLVKLCVGPPVRQRRGQNIISAPPIPSSHATNVATALNKLLVDGLDCEKLPPCPNPKCRLTFLICSIGFTSPMLFDERRYPYHLMLKKFISLDGQNTLFKTFQWALDLKSCSAFESIDYAALPEGTLGFLDAWLTLVEKLVNPKTVIESPHVISNRSGNSFGFDPFNYLKRIHRQAFENVKLLWRKKRAPCGERTTETLLTIMRHIFRGEKIIKEKLKSEETKSDTATISSAGPSTEPAGLRQLVDMGFSRESALEALQHTSSLEHATEYLLSNPSHLSRSTNSMDVGLEEDQVQQAIAISLESSAAGTSTENAKPSQEEQEKLFDAAINDFAINALEDFLKLLDELPDTVHKVCDLLVTLMKRNTIEYSETIFDNLIDEMMRIIHQLSYYVFNNGISIVNYYSVVLSEPPQRLHSILHLFILLFESPFCSYMKGKCGLKLYKIRATTVTITLITRVVDMMIKLRAVKEPKWLAPGILFVDLLAKADVCHTRKIYMHLTTTRIWRWYDLVTGRWAQYSNNNNRLINEAYWSGEPSIRVTCGRKRYTITFANMLQVNDETGNNRPICMTLATFSHPNCSDINSLYISEPLYTELTHREENRALPILGGTTFDQKLMLIKATCDLLALPTLDKNILHSALQLSARLTRDYEMAKVFVHNGGIKSILAMRQLTEFNGFGILSTVLIRHTLEEPNTLQYSMEKIIRGRTLSTIPPPYKDLIYMIRQISGAVARHPYIFWYVAAEILRADTANYKGEPPEVSLPVRVEPPSRAKAPPLEDACSFEVISDLLKALLEPLEDKNVGDHEKPIETIQFKSKLTQTEPMKDTTGIVGTFSNPEHTTAPGAVTTSNASSQTGEDIPSVTEERPAVSAADDANKSAEDNEKADEDLRTPEEKERSGFKNLSKKPMLPKSVILKILADAVVSYGPIAKLITDFKYKASDSEFLTEDTTALAFIFDKILPTCDNIADSDCSTMSRMLIAALASSNHSPEAQITLVSEVKLALIRALNLPESSDKHHQIQNICGIISTMIDNCPLAHPNRWTNCSVNNIVKLMIRRGIFNDLAKITHYLDLSSPHTPFTANSALKPLESLSRTINQPGPNGNQSKNRKSHHTHEDTTEPPTLSTEQTNAQGEELEDTENTEHDISAVASSLENNSVSTGRLDNTLEEMMQHILQHRSDNSQGYNDVPSSRNTTMDIDEECTIDYDHERDATEELMSTDSGESDSNPSDQVDDDGNDDNDGDDDNIDDNDDNDDSNFYDDDNDRRRGGGAMFRLAANDRDEDILMIQYETETNTGIPRMIRWNENGFTVPLLEHGTTTEPPGTITHPLLISRAAFEAGQNSTARNQRNNRTRRYQYLFSPRNPNPPVILQRLLGPDDPHLSNVLSSANNFLNLPDLRENARVVVMDNFGIIPSNEEQIDFVDQSGYLFGPSLAATLSYIPPVLHWWNIESKLLDMESTNDAVMFVCNKLIPVLINTRNEELRNKKAKEKDEIAKKTKQRSNPEAEAAPESVVSNDDELTNTPVPSEVSKQGTDLEDIDGVPIPTVDLTSTDLDDIESVAAAIVDLTRQKLCVRCDVISNHERLSESNCYQNEYSESDDSSDEEGPVPLKRARYTPEIIDLTSEPEIVDLTRDEDLDGEPVEISDTSNESSQDGDVLLSRLPSFLRGNENSQTSDVTQNASVQTIDPSEPRMFNNRSETSETSIQNQSNPFEMSLTAYVRSRNNAFGRPVGSSFQQHIENLLESQGEPIGLDVQTHNNPLRAILEETVSQQTDSPSPEQPAAQHAETSEHSTIDQREPEPEGPESAEPTTSASTSENSSYTAEQNAPVANADVVIAGPSSSNDDEEIPEGVDPSFLEALPPEIRREVLEQHRILCIQQRYRAAQESGEEYILTTPQVNPDFLAALPPSLQEEVLSQHRMELQRQAAARANPDEPVDAASFFETLQPSLRTMILSDMEDSQMSVLPPDLAQEAQNLRRDWYARNRQMAQERFLQTNLSAIYRHSRGRQSLRPNNFHRSGWGQWSRDFVSNSAVTNNQIKIRGRQLLDHEGIACLLILLFTDDSHLNKLRLHRVIRNLCYHAPTREWVINCLLSIIEKSVNVQLDESLNKPTRKGPKPGPLTSKLLTDTKHLQNGGHWLTIRMEAALGCAANVFILNKATGKKCDKSSGANTISIHPQAAPIVCRNTLDLLTSLAKAFPSCLIPVKAGREEVDKNALTPVKIKLDSSDFWDVLIRLDCSTKKGKSIQKQSNSSSTLSDSEISITFDQTAFGKLLNMLASPVVKRNTQLTDNLLKLLSVTTSGMPDLGKSHKPGRGRSVATEIINKPPTNALNLVVNVITYQNCSEEGLEFITHLLLNLANSSLDMSFMILNLLLNGAVEIGSMVEQQIQDMLKDLRDLIGSTQKRKLEDTSGPSSSKGVIYNRFTNEQVIVTASTKVKSACELQLPSMVPLTSKSSSQVFFLRVLRVIVQIRNSIKQSMKKADSTFYELPALSEQLTSLNSLWNSLSLCLFELEHAPDHHAVLVLQPTVEAFFLVHSPQQGAAKQEKKEKDDEESAQGGSESESAPLTGKPSKTLTETQEQHEVLTDPEKSSDNTLSKPAVNPEQHFLAFAETHRTVLNQILRQSTAHLADGPFAVLVDHTRILDFDIKRRYFRTELERMDHGVRREETAVHVRRSNIFEDSFRELFRRPPEEWKNRFYIVFEDEEGQDAGGLLREWYVIISRDIFNPMYALFTVSPGDRVTYMINSASHYNSNHLCYYKFVGRVIAKAIYDNKLLECYFTRSFYKHILGIPVKYTDMESEDYSFYRGLVYLMENNISNMDIDLTFSTEISEFGVTETRDLIPNGRHIPVTEENKMEYIRLVCQMKMTGAIKQQLNSFLEGFYDIIPMRLISIFNEQELELLISGLPNVDIEDLKANTEYHKYQTNSLQIQWFWRALRSFDQADRAKFLQFVTGTSKVPLQGFGALEGMNGVQKFQIHRDDRSTDRLPSAHTCFNQLDLPVYETYDKLRAYLLKAIHECSEGFGFA